MPPAHAGFPSLQSLTIQGLGATSLLSTQLRPATALRAGKRSAFGGVSPEDGDDLDEAGLLGDDLEDLGLAVDDLGDSLDADDIGLDELRKLGLLDVDEEDVDDVDQPADWDEDQGEHGSGAFGLYFAIGDFIGGLH